MIFAVLVLSLFWGGFVFMLVYTLKTKSRPGENDPCEPQQQTEK